MTHSVAKPPAMSLLSILLIIQLLNLNIPR